ncbi:MAG: amino acid ABC transporter ATP-binding protein [Pseudomonadota bacterium]|nr:amino acid ABC transporter ATP-binding protein [Pseudomonadota bacterium]
MILPARPDQTPMVRLDRVWKLRGRMAVLKDVSFDAARGEVVCLLGPSGAGKSTLLRCINGLEPTDRGVVWVDDEPIGCRERGGSWFRLPERDVAAQRAGIGMVFQSFNLFPHMTVLQNVCDAPVRVRHHDRSTVRERAMALLDQVGLCDKAASYPRHLSGGQQQRVAIARALAMQPGLMLFDEPTSALDPHLVGEVLDVIRGLAASGMTMLIVTHEVQFAREIADRAAVMLDGVIAEIGPARQVLTAPRHAGVRSFLSRALPPESRPA